MVFYQLGLATASLGFNPFGWDCCLVHVHSQGNLHGANQAIICSLQMANSSGLFPELLLQCLLESILFFKAVEE